MKTYIFTCGDINGIGPEIVIKTLNRLTGINGKFIFTVPLNVFEEVCSLVAPRFSYTMGSNDSGKQVLIKPLPKAPIKKGMPTKASGRAAFSSIQQSFKLLNGKKADAVITAPISKHALHLAGVNYPGHTEMYADWCGVNDYVMMFLSKKMNAALATIHEPLKNVSRLITRKRLNSVINTCCNTLLTDIKIKEPSIAVLGLNPHAGEDGAIGREEEDIVKPLLKEINYGMRVDGPFSPDAFFANALYKKYNLILGMYHDQVLIPFKLLNFSSGVNYTAGLPVVRTSPDHGTAFDIAWQNKASELSMYEAFTAAAKIVKNREER